ncbi:T9SS type A sorting domain-containing protein [candidate division WOR-3 bacterium]|nr:T9SS type A sorting domain-containing protein [candidate division WOR-3 bacterium]
MKNLLRTCALFSLLLYSFCFSEGARYLIITHDDLYEAICPLAEWKTKKGMLAKVVKLSEIGNSASQIRTYITVAYNEWETKPEYLLLVGDDSKIEMPEYGGAPNSDNYYTDIESDFYNEIIPGRFPAVHENHVGTMVSKTLGYEKTPYIDDPLWFRQGTVIVREDLDGSGDDDIYWGDAFFAIDKMLECGYTLIDTFSGLEGDNADDVEDAVTNGRTFVQFRGSSVAYWWQPFDIDPNDMVCEFKLPVIVSATCATCHGIGYELLTAGGVDSPRGAVGFAGTTIIGVDLACFRSALARGFVEGMFEHSLNLGLSCEEGRKKVYNLYNSIEHYNSFICLGDPELNLWTFTPEVLTVSYPEIIALGTLIFAVNVHNSGDSSPVPNALVCLMMGEDIYAYEYTDAQGEVNLSIYPQQSGDMSVTVTANNYIPFEGTATVIILHAPTNLIADVVSYDKVVLNWEDNSNYEDYYIIQRKPVGGEWETIGSVPANVTTYTDTKDLLFSYDYYYRVYAEIDGGGCSDFSNEALVMLNPTFTGTTGGVNGKNLLRDKNSCLHAVYQHQNKIWYISSLDNGRTWSEPYQISDDENIAQDPALSYFYGYGPVVAWSELTSIKYRYLTSTGWNSISTIDVPSSWNARYPSLCENKYSGGADLVFDAKNGTYHEIYIYLLRPAKSFLDSTFISNGSGWTEYVQPSIVRREVYDNKIVLWRKYEDYYDYDFLKYASKTHANEWQGPWFVDELYSARRDPFSISHDNEEYVTMVWIGKDLHEPRPPLRIYYGFYPDTSMGGISWGVRVIDNPDGHQPQQVNMAKNNGYLYLLSFTSTYFDPGVWYSYKAEQAINWVSLSLLNGIKLEGPIPNKPPHIAIRSTIVPGEYTDVYLQMLYTYVDKVAFKERLVRRIYYKGGSQTALEDTPLIHSLSLYPNPAMNDMTIRICVPKKKKVSLKIYDVLGKEVKTLEDNKLDVGYHNITLNSKNLPSGIYFAKFVSDKYKITKKFVLMK